MEKKGHGVKKLLLNGLTVLLVCVLAYSVFQIVRSLAERERGRQVHEHMTKLVVTEKQQPTAAPQPQQYHIPITVEFDSLLRQNEDIRGWIYCPDTPINYPVLQGTDNQYYLRHMVNGEYNRAGSILLDYRCAGDFSDAYNLVHGHNLKDDTMFGSLVNYADQDYLQAHPVVYLLTPAGDYVVELFAGFTANSDDKIYSIPATKQHRTDMVENCIARSDFVSRIIPSQDDRLVIFSTCSYAYDDARYVVIGVLREI